MNKWALVFDFGKFLGQLYNYDVEQKADWKATYHDYLLSDEWKKKAEAAKKRAGYRCQLCNSADGLNTHHRTYDRIGHERANDLTVLCSDCHEKFHDINTQ